mgnify:CR=1 FL=1
MSFKKWMREYEEEFNNELIRWGQNAGFKGKNGKPAILPEGFEEYTLARYTAYRNEMATKKLVGATWFLAIATIILSIISLFIK